MCRKTNKHFSSILCSFVLLYREVANSNCWKYKKGEEESKTKGDDKDERGIFSETQSADLLPKVCNDLILTIFDDADPMEVNDYGLERDHCIDFSIVFLKWLYEESFTDYKVRLSFQNEAKSSK